jgi:hypothetical protein
MPLFVSPFPTTVGVPYDELIKPGVVTPGYGPADRADPFWSMVWPDSSGGPTVGWRSLNAERTMTDAGVSFVSHRSSGRNVDEARKMLARRRSRLTAFATINLWRTITSQQLVAMQARASLNTHRADDISLLFDAELIQRGRFFYDGVLIAGYPEIFRPDPASATADFSHLRYADWLGATLGGPFVRGHQYDRHNVLMTELSLRAAELTPLRSVLGEAAAAWPRIFGSELAPNPHRVGDGVWVREDGLKILVEMSASVTPATAVKIDQLAELLARDKTKSVMVLFVAATTKAMKTQVDVAHLLRRAVKKSAHSSRTRILADVEDRMIVAKWEDWFPGPGLASYEFVQLRGRHYDAREDDWKSIDLLDPYETPFEHAEDVNTEEMMTNLNSVLGVPHWMQNGRTTDFDGWLLEQSGFAGLTAKTGLI